MAEIGRTTWVIADGHIPGWSNGPAPEMVSHEALNVLNASERDANLEVTIYFADREPAGPYRLHVAPRRVKHFRLNEFSDPEPLPAATDYGVVVQSDVPVVVQQTRLDSRQAENGLFSTIAFGV